MKIDPLTNEKYQRMDEARFMQEKRDEIKRAIEDRKEYDEFESWCTEHSPDSWMPFDEWRSARNAAAIENSHPVWAGDDPKGAA